MRNLHSLSGRADQLAIPYRAYMQITCLEMEKARRDSERRSASQRIAEIDARLREIEAEKTRILGLLAERKAASCADLRKLEARHSRRPSTGGFKIRY